METKLFKSKRTWRPASFTQYCSSHVKSGSDSLARLNKVWHNQTCHL